MNRKLKENRSLATILAAKKSVGVAPKVNLKDSFYTGKIFWNSVQAAPEIQTKSIDVLKIFMLFTSQCIKYLKKSDKLGNNWQKERYEQTPTPHPYLHPSQQKLYLSPHLHNVTFKYSLFWFSQIVAQLLLTEADNNVSMDI